MFVLPLCLGVILVNLFTDHWDYTSYATSYKGLVNGTIYLPDTIFQGDIRSLFSDLLSISPYLYTVVFYIIGGLFASAYICMGLAFSMFIKNYYLLIFTPQIIYTSIWFLAVEEPALAPLFFISPSPGVVGVSLSIIVSEFLLQILFSLVIYFIGIRKHADVL